MEIVLGVSVTPATVHLVLVQGENADGVTVEQDDFPVPADGAAPSALDQVLAAILGTREAAVEGGYRLASTGVALTDQAQAVALRAALNARSIENVMLVSAFLAAAALTQSVGGSVGYLRTALLFVAPDSATLAVVDSADGSISQVRRRPLSEDDNAALTQLTTMVSGLRETETPPGGVFVVGTGGVDVALLKPALEAATSLPLSVSEEPESALARGAALASANAPLFSSSTRALAWAQDPGTGRVAPELVARAGYAQDYDVTLDQGALAYSADPDSRVDLDYRTGAEDDAGAGYGDDQLTTALHLRQQRRMPFLVAASAMATLLVVGVIALLIALAVEMRPGAGDRPDAAKHIVVSTKAPASPPVNASPIPPSAPPAPPPSAPPPAVTPPAVTAPPAPAPAPAKPEAPRPTHRAVQRPTPAYTPAPAPAPAPAPEAAPPAPAPPPPPPAPQLPQMPPMTMWLHLPFVSIPIPLNPPPPPPPP